MGEEITISSMCSVFAQKVILPPEPEQCGALGAALITTDRYRSREGMD